MTLGNSVRLDFRSTCDMLDLVQVISDHCARRAGLDDEAVHWFCVAVRESVINAIKHGNAGDEQKRVYVEFTEFNTETPPGVAIRVRDEGCGFDPTTLPDPLAPENVLKTHGRGLFLMRSFMDEMTLQQSSQGGMEVIMLKRAAPQRV